MDEIIITQKILIDRVKDLMCSAFEGGSNYWYFIQEEHGEEAEYTWEKPFEGGYLMISDIQADDPQLKDKPVRLDLQAIEKGLKLLAASEDYRHHWCDFIRENDDATTADVFLQFCVFGDVVYS